MQILCFTSLFSLETTALAFTLCHHHQSHKHSCHLGDAGDKAAKRALPFIVHTGQFWNGQDCLFFWYTCTMATQSFLCCSVLVGGCLPVQPEAVVTDYQGTVLPFDTPNTPPPPPAVFTASLFWPLLHHSSISQRHSVHRCWNTISLLINYNVSVIIQSHIHVHVAYAIDTCTVWCTCAI